MDNGPMNADPIVLVTLSGADREGSLQSLLAALEQGSTAVLDVGQAVVHQEFTLGLLIRLNAQESVDAFSVRITRLAESLSHSCRVQPISPQDYAEWVADQGVARHVITLLARHVAPVQLARISAIAATHGLNVAGITRLSGRTPLHQTADLPSTRAIVEFRLRGQLGDAASLRADLVAVSRELGVDIGVQADDAFRRHRRVVAFDMDSTLIKQEVIDELASAYGVGDQVRAITAAAMRGEMDFQQSFRARVKLLKGAPVQLLEDICARIELSEGAERLISTLKTHGYRTAILSGGFQSIGDRLKNRLGIDYVFANRLVADDGRFTGEVEGEIIDGAGKARLLGEIVGKEGLLLAHAVAVGDGANDLPMLSTAGLGIAYHAKPIVAARAGYSINHFGLDAILYLMGFTDRDLILPEATKTPR